MKGSNDSMMLRGADAPALGVEERSDEAPGAGAAAQRLAQGPDAEETRRQTRRIQSSEPQGPATRSEGGAAGEGTGHGAHDHRRAGKRPKAAAALLV